MNFLKNKINLPTAVAGVISRDAKENAAAAHASAAGPPSGGEGESLMQRLRKKISSTSLLGGGGGSGNGDEQLIDIDSAPSAPASGGGDEMHRSTTSEGGGGHGVPPARPPVPAPRGAAAGQPSLTIRLDESGACPRDASDAVKEFSFANSDDGLGKRPALLPTPSGNLIKFASDRDLVRAAAAAAAADACDRRGVDEPASDDGAESDASSEPQYSRDSAARSGSVHSIDSAELNADDSVYDNMQTFAKEFLRKVFIGESTTEAEKLEFEELVKNGLFRQLLARNIEEMTADSGRVSEHVFYQLVQHFAMVLDKCDEDDDFSPAKALMQACFKVYYEDEDAHGKPRKLFLYSYVKAQPIWQSMRFWNAAFFETIQTERMRLATSDSPDKDTDKDDEVKLQESIVFGHLGTYTCNMCAVGLKKEWCLEFLRKQAYLGGLDEERINMLKENMERL